MKAIVQDAYGSPDVLNLKEVAKPAVKENDVLIRVRAAGLNAGDYFFMRGRPWAVRLFIGFPRPRNHIPGWDVAGYVEAVGRSVTRFHPGDKVYGLCSGSCAEYACDAEENFAPKPANLTLEQASTVPTAALTALQGFRDKGNIQPGQRVLINGASGGVGTFAVQIAKTFSADVTGVCSTEKVDLVRSLGADHVIDYTHEDFTQGGQRYDLVLDNVGSHPFADLRRTLTPRGIIVPNTGHAGIGYVVKALVLSLFTRRHARPFHARSSHEDLLALNELIEAGRVKPVIDGTYPLTEVREAFRYLDRGHARGKVVITVEPDSER
jgi:NADPH:quinone reductase-like Zn-dependent oxidoreductase